jgi:cellulose synthase/poly-beta-1,6-N-acetylglucosamine synthase-like glycosyltransferase
LVVIGRNEGARLARCLASVRAIPHRVYVDSGSSDGSVKLALSEGVRVVELDVPPEFTAARARNAGLSRLLEDEPDLEFVQMVDGDCEVQSGWIEAAIERLRADSTLALVFGRRRERHPERSLYNALCDDEWNVPVGIANGVGGDALFRVEALRAVNFYDPRMIAGEDTELAMRLRKAGWLLRRIDVEMTLHDAAITRFSQWWKRMRRSGHGYGEMAYLHPDARDPHWPRIVRRIVFWGALMPTAAAVAAVLAIVANGRWALVTLLIIGLTLLNSLRIAVRQRRRGLRISVASGSGLLLMLGKIPQFFGLLDYHFNRLSGKASRLIEYKGAGTT